MDLANERVHQFYQTDKRLDWVSVGKWDSIYDMRVESVLLSMDGKNHHGMLQGCTAFLNLLCA